jgi:uncharacterized membrane protein YeaQ/YmgE (transglycosylase-associated protein family)
MKPASMKARTMRSHRTRSRPAAACASLVAALALNGCKQSPNFNILGSFFPAWLICIALGIVFAAVARWVFARLGLDKDIPWTIVVYPCLAACFACTLWLIFFS